MESLQESIRDMEKERQRIKTLKEDLSHKLKMARQRLQRLKNKAHPLTGVTSRRRPHGEVFVRKSVDSEPTAAELAIQDAELQQ